MDPNNNNQPINTNPFAQSTATQQPPAGSGPTPTPISTSPVQPVQPTVNQNIPVAPKKSSKLLPLLIILILLILGIAGYVVFANGLINNKQATSNTSVVIPTVIPPTPTPQTIDQISVENPDTDIKAIETDVQSL